MATILILITLFFCLVYLLLTFIEDHLTTVYSRGPVFESIRNCTDNKMHFMDTTLFSNFITWESCKKSAFSLLV